MDPLHNSSFIIHNSTAVPLYFWRGARPWLLDLPESENGWAVCLCLQREGDCCLLPLAWETGTAVPHPTLHTQALDSEALQLTLTSLQRDGWVVNGRLTLTFTGHYTDPHFHQTTHSYLWHTPNQKDEL